MAALLAPAAPAMAQATGQSEVRKTLESRRNELESAETRAKVLQEDMRDISDQREKLNQRLLETAGLIQKSEARMSAIEARIGELEAQEKLLQGSLAQRHDQIAKLLSGLLRMGRNPPPVMVTRREDALQMVRSAMLIAAAFPELKDQALALATRLDELMRVMTDIRTEGDRLKSETARLSDARTRLTGLMDSKKQSLTERQAELEDVRKTAASISKSVGELNELIVQLDKAVTANTGLGAYEEEMKAKGAETAKSDPKPETVAAVAPPAVPAAPLPVAKAESKTADTAKPEKATEVAALAPPKSSVIELAPNPANAITGNPGRIKPAIPFQQAKARLPLPAQGRRVLSFGEKTQYGGQSKGLVLETRAGAQITSPCDGWIVYAGEFRSYGQLLIINAGGGYHILLAGLSQIDVQPGQFVLAAEPIGTMTGSSAASPKTQTSAPVLYVEFRKEGRPVDPDPWWVETRQEGHQKVQG